MPAGTTSMRRSARGFVISRLQPRMTSRRMRLVPSPVTRSSRYLPFHLSPSRYTKPFLAIEPPLLDDSIASVETVHSGGRVCNASFGAVAIYVRWLELSGPPDPRVPKYERGTFCVCKFFVSD